MKKIIAFILCAMLICALPIVASAEEAPDADVTVTEEVTEEVIEKTMTEVITEWVQENIEEISVIGTLLAAIFYEVRKHGKLNGSIGTLNNNAVTIAEKSADAVNKALSKVEAISEKVDGYKQAFDTLLEEIRVSEEEKKALTDALIKVEEYLKSAKLANVEFADELANLLCLANIPNSKKEEFFSRHIAAVNAIANTEVKEDVGNETN